MHRPGRQQALADQRAAIDRKVEEERAQDAALQGYLEYMSTLLLENKLRSSEADSEVRSLARARTLQVLQQLRADPTEEYTEKEDTDKEQLMEFLIEAGLITRVDGEDPVIRLEEASLSRTDLDYEELRGTVLEAADLRGANLKGAHLEGADLSGANLNGAGLRAADLSDAELINANLTQARLIETDLTQADFWGADLSDAELSGANLFGAKVTDYQLEEARSLKGATMPNGQKYEEWLKDKEGHGEGGENDSPS